MCECVGIFPVGSGDNVESVVSIWDEDDRKEQPGFVCFFVLFNKMKADKTDVAD